MATIITRELGATAKGSPLTNAELDQNIINLNTDKIEADSIDELTNKIIDSYTNHVGADHIHFKVKATTAITKGQILKIVGYNQGEDAIEVAPWNSQLDTAVAIAHENLSNGSFGLALHAGIIEGVNTSAFNVGQVLYPASNGTLTATKPTTGNYQAVAFVLKSQSNNGALLVEFTEPKPVLATVATSGLFSDLGNKPTTVAGYGITDAATISYVDQVAQGIASKPAVKAATTANLSATYSNGTNGVGATLTATSNGAFPLIDGVQLSTTNGDRGLLVKNQTNPAHNGRYNLTTLGDAGTPWVLTRCGLCDTADEIPSAYVFVQEGTLYANTGWVAVVAELSTFTVGTDAISWQQFSGAGTYTAGTGLTLNGTQFSITNTGVTAGTYGSSTSIPSVTVNAQGQITAISGNAISVGTGVLTVNTSGTGISGSGTFNANSSTNQTITITSNATSANTANAIVSRDASGNFSAGTITASLSGNATTATTLATGRTISITGDLAYTSESFNGSVNVTGTATLANSGVNAGTYGAVNTIPAITVDSKGRVTSVSTYGVDFSSYLPLSGGTLTGTLNLSGGLNVVASPLRIQRSSISQTGQDDNVSITVGDSDITFTHNNDADGDASLFAFNYVVGGVSTNIFAFDAASARYRGNIVLHAGNYSSYALPLSGGALSGVLTINSTSDNQLLLQSTDSWTGIGFNDSAPLATDYIWHNGTNGTFSLGGGGANVANKKLHVHGGMTVGANYAATTNPTNGLNVEGAIQQAGNQVLHAGNYNSYAPTLTGTGASGTWGISVTGSAGTAGSTSTLTESATTSAPSDSLQYLNTNGTTTDSPTTDWWNIIRMGHGNPNTYYNNTLAMKMTGSGVGGLWGRTRTNGTAGSWFRFFDDNYHPNADVLTTARTINGTSFNGSANITTANWGTARDINGTSVNGSGNYAIGRIYDTNYRRITNPGGGEYVTSSSTITGAIAVTLPVGATNTMVRITIKIYEYATNEAFEVHVGGYNYTSGTWANNPFAYIIGNPGVDRRFTVRLGYNSTTAKFIVYVGELASTWSYPQVYVTEVQCGYGGQQVAWTTGWSVGFEASAFQSVTATISNCQVGYAVSTNTANSTVLRDSSGNFSAGTITAALSGNATTATTLQTARTINGVSFNGSANINVNGLNYNVNNSWLRENGDDAHFKIYGNSRQVAFRTDGTTEYASGVGAYAFAWMYGGDAASNRRMLLDANGDLWTSANGWLSTGLASKLNLSGGTVTGTLSVSHSAQATVSLGGIAASWGGISYPTLYSSNVDRWVMHINPHISYTQNGVNGFTGSMTGSTIRFASNPAAATYWDLGVNGGGANLGADVYGISRAGTWNGYWDNGGNAFSRVSHRAPIFYDSNDTAYYLDPSATTSLKIAGNIELGNNHGFPNVEWSASGNSTGMIIISLPGTTSNYGMIHAVIDVYEYSSPRTATIIVGGHNWQTSWYNTAVNVIGYTDKSVRLGVKDGRFCIVLGGVGSVWNYGTVRLRKIHNASFYDNVMDIGGSYSITQTNTESFSNVSGDLRELRTSNYMYAYGYRGHSNVAGTGTASYHPNGVYSTGTNWLYGTIITNNASINAGTGTIESGRTYGYTDIRSPIFYDYNNTGYYVDPNSTTSIRTVGSWRSDSSTWDGEFSGKIQYHSSNWYLQAAGNWLFRNSGGSNIFDVNQSGTAIASADMRAPIFYDSSNTGYYTDPASTSRMNSITTDAGQSISGWGTNYDGSNSGQGLHAYRYGFQKSGAWSNPYPDLVINYHTGISFGANPGYEGYTFWNDYTHSSVIFRINGGSSYTYKYTWMFTNTTGFYSDTNGWHIEPNSTSTYGGTMIRGVRNGWRGIHFYDGGNTPHYMFDGSANGGLYYESGGRWAHYYNYSNNCTGFSASTTSSSYAIYASGAIYSTGNIVAYSDKRIKENVKPIKNSLDIVNKLQGVKYNKIGQDKTEIGFLAQDVAEHLPEVVTYAEDVDQYGVSYGNITALLVEAVKELSAEVKRLKEKLGE